MLTENAPVFTAWFRDTTAVSALFALVYANSNVTAILPDRSCTLVMSDWSTPSVVDKVETTFIVKALTFCTVLSSELSEKLTCSGHGRLAGTK